MLELVINHLKITLRGVHTLFGYLLLLCNITVVRNSAGTSIKDKEMRRTWSTERYIESDSETGPVGIELDALITSGSSVDVERASPTI